LSTSDHIHLLPNLTWLDLSFNELRKINNVDGLTKLQELYYANNKITEIEGLETLLNLTQLELGSNRIRTIKNLDSLTGLEQLWLGKNKVTELCGLDKLTKLTKLSIQSNRLTTIGEGLSSCVNLRELYLSHNGLKNISGLSQCTHLQILDLTANQITKIENLEECVELEELWVGSNFVESLDDLDCLKSTKLETIYLERNPVESDPHYRAKIMKKFPNLLQIDANLVEDFIHEIKDENNTSEPNDDIEPTERERQCKSEPNALLDSLLAKRKEEQALLTANKSDAEEKK